MTADKLTIWSTRKAYLHLYSLPILVIAALKMLTNYNINLNQYSYIIAASCAIIGILYSELERITYRIDVVPTAITVEKGLLMRKRIIMPRHIITDMDVSQTPFQRILNYGNVSVRSFSEDHKKISITTHDPHKVATKIHELLKKGERNVGTSPQKN